MERLLAESTKLQGHREQSCVIRINVTVQRVGLSVLSVYSEHCMLLSSPWKFWTESPDDASHKCNCCLFAARQTKDKSALRKVSQSSSCVIIVHNYISALAETFEHRCAEQNVQFESALFDGRGPSADLHTETAIEAKYATIKCIRASKTTTVLLLIIAHGGATRVRGGVT